MLLVAGPFNVAAGPAPVIPGLTEKASPAFANGRRVSSIMNELGMGFVYIPPGEFQMGSPPDEPGRQANETAHRVQLSQGFYMMTTEVTQKQWMAVMGQNPSVFSDCGPDCPVENVPWSQIFRFITRLNHLMKTKQAHIKLSSSEKEINAPAGDEITAAVRRLQYRLPTEAQWEYACRATGRGWFSFEGDLAALDEYAWFKGNSGGSTHPVAQKKPNAFGLYDMHGNVWEWCLDFAGPYPSKPVTDPKGMATGSFRVVRGGSWYYPALEARTANRSFLLPGSGNYNVGFRLVLTP